MLNGYLNKVAHRLNNLVKLILQDTGYFKIDAKIHSLFMIILFYIFIQIG